MSTPTPDNNPPVLQGRVVIQDKPVPDSPGIGSRLAALGRAIAGYIGPALSAFSAAYSPPSTTRYSLNSPPVNLTYEPTHYNLASNQPKPVAYQQIAVNKPQPLGQEAMARVSQLQAQANRVALQPTHQQVSHVLDQLARSQGLPTYKEFHAQNGAAYPAPPNPGTLGIAQYQAAQRQANRPIQVQSPDYSSIEHAQATPQFLNYQAQVLENQRQAMLAEQQRQAAHIAWANQKAAELRQRHAPKPQPLQPVQRQPQQASFTTQIQKTNQDALIEQAFHDPRNPQNNILEQAQGPGRLDESKLAQAELNIDVLKAKGQLTPQQAQELSVAAKLATAKNWLQHEGVDTGNGKITYRGVQIDKSTAPMVAYADAKRYWDKNTHLSKQEIATAAAQFAKGIYDFFIGEDINTLLDPKAALLARVLAGVSLASNFIPGAWIEKAGGRFIEKLGGKLLVKVSRKAEEVIAKLVEKGLSPEQIKNYKRFVSDRKLTTANVYHLPNGGKVFEGIKEAKHRTDSHTVWQKFVDKDGKTVIYGHRTEYKDGTLLHWHEDFPNDGLEINLRETNGAPYIEHLKRILYGTKG